MNLNMMIGYFSQINRQAIHRGRRLRTRDEGVDMIKLLCKIW